MTTTETPVIERRDQKHARQIAEGIIEIFNELDLEWITGSYDYLRPSYIGGPEEVYAACAVGAMRTKIAQKRVNYVSPTEAGEQLFGLTSHMCDDYGQSGYPTFEHYQTSNCYMDEPVASCRQKYADYLFGVKIGTRVRLHFRGEE
jgi:hypothetical protein